MYLTLTSVVFEYRQWGNYGDSSKFNFNKCCI